MAVVLNQRVRWAAGLCLALAACAPDDEPLDMDGLGDASQPVVVAPDAGITSDSAVADAAPNPLQDAGVSPGSRDAATVVDAAPAQPEAGLDAASSDASADASASDSATATDAAGDARVVDASSDAGATGCSALTYQSFGQQFFVTYCASCHSGANASQGIRLDTLANVKTNAAAIRRQAVTAQSMPPRMPRPSAAVRQKLGQFLDCGPN